MEYVNKSICYSRTCYKVVCRIQFFFVLKSILCGCIKAYFCPKHIKIKHDYLHVRLIYVHLQYDYRWQTTCLDLSRMLWRLQNQLYFVLNFPKSRNICQMVKYFILKWKPYSNQLHFKIYFSSGYYTSIPYENFRNTK